MSKLNIIEYKIANNEEELKEAVEYFAKQKFSEGAMIKAANAEYSLSGMTSHWWKFKNEFDIDAKVIKVEKVKGADAYIYLCVLVDENGKEIPIGKTYSTTIKADVGEIIRVAFVNLNRYTDPETGEIWFNWWAPRVIEKREDLSETSTVDFANDIVEKSGGEVAEKKFPARYRNIKKNQKIENLEEIIKTPEISKEDEEKIEKWNSISAEEIKSMDLKKLPKNFFVMVMHFRGKSVHFDFRRKENGFLNGETIASQVQGAIREDIDSIEKAKEIAKKIDDEKFFKFRPSMTGEAHILIMEKATQPIDWLAVIKDEVKPGTIGATRFEEGIFYGIDWGLLWRGVQKPYFKEFFLYGRNFKRRMVERLLPTGEWERVGKEKTNWQAWLTDSSLPYLLSERGRKRKDYVPPEGESGISPEWENAIPDNLKWWNKNLQEKEKIKMMDSAYDWLIENGYIKAKKLKLSKKEKFVLQRRWWKGQAVIRNQPKIFYDLRFEEDGQIYTIRLNDSPLAEEKTSAIIEETDYAPPKGKSSKEWLSFEGEIPAEEIPEENPNQDIPAYIEILDSGEYEMIEETETFIHFNFKGKKLKGRFALTREDPRSEIWIFSRSAKVGEIIEKEEE